MKNIVIEFKNGFNEIDEFEMPLKGYRNDILVSCPNGKKYNLCFYEPIRLCQDTEDGEAIIEQNLIVIKNLTRENINDTINKMWVSNFFSKLKEED